MYGTGIGTVGLARSGLSSHAGKQDGAIQRNTEQR